MIKAALMLDNLVDPLADLRVRFLDRSRQRVAMLGEALASEPPRIDTIAQLAHQIAGSAGTFGYPALSRAAATLEATARTADESSAPANRNALRLLLHDLEAQLVALDKERQRAGC